MKATAARTRSWIALFRPALLGVAGLVGTSACTSGGYFVCSQDSECTEAAGGRCEPSGACSFPDPVCPTGRRYGEAGNPQIAGECVPPSDAGSSGPDASAGEGTGNGSTGEGSSSSASPTSSSGGGSTTDASTGDTGPGESSTSTASSSSTGAQTSSSSTGDPGPPRDMYETCDLPEDCDAMLCAFFVEPGSLDPLGDFCSDIDCIDPAVDCLDPGTGATPTCVDIPVNGVVEPICALDCEATGAAGCPDGMFCLDNILGVPAMCAHSP